MRFRILNCREVKEIRKMLKEQYGVEEKIEYVFLRMPNDKVYITNRDLEFIELDRLRINTIGLYFGEIAHGKIRLSVSGCQIVGPLANKNMYEMDDKEVRLFFEGGQVEGENAFVDGVFVLMKHRGDFVGMGQYKKEKILNYLNKSYRAKELII